MAVNFENHKLKVIQGGQDESGSANKPKPKRKATAPLDCMKITNNGNDAFVLWRIQFKYRKAKTRRFGRLWFVETQVAMAKELSLTVKKVQASLARLEKANLIETMTGKNPYDGMKNATFYRLTDDAENLLWGEDTKAETPTPEADSQTGKSDAMVDELEKAWGAAAKEQGKYFSGWSPGQRKFAEEMVDKIDGKLLLPAFKFTLGNWYGFQTWVSHKTTIHNTPDDPELLFMRKHLDHMVNYWQEEQASAKKKKHPKFDKY